MTLSMFINIFNTAILETMVDNDTKLFSGIPIITGSYSLLLGFHVDLATLSLALGVLTGLAGVIEKGLKIYKEFKTLGEEKKEEKPEVEKSDENN